MKQTKQVGSLLRQTMSPSHWVQTARAAALALALVVVGAVLQAPPAVAGNGLIWVKAKDVNLMALSPAADAEFDIKIVRGSKAVSRLRAALITLVESSPLSATVLAALRDKGDVFIVYDPSFPESNLTNVLGDKLAKFRPDLFDNAADLTDGIAFPVVIGRYLAKWPRNEIAAVLASEMIGLGIQHLEGRLDTMGEMDSKCEAGLYKEQVHQDLGFDKHSSLRVKFRQDLEWRWCTDFKRYMKAQRPAQMALWKQLNPDVPKLLVEFADYVTAKRSFVTAQVQSE
jgi:hypothetical protein